MRDSGATISGRMIVSGDTFSRSAGPPPFSDEWNASWTLSELRARKPSRSRWNPRSFASTVSVLIAMRMVSAAIESGVKVFDPSRWSGVNCAARSDATVSVEAPPTSNTSIVIGAVGAGVYSAAVPITTSAVSTSVMVLSVRAVSGTNLVGSVS